MANDPQKTLKEQITKYNKAQAALKMLEEQYTSGQIDAKKYSREKNKWEKQAEAAKNYVTTAENYGKGKLPSNAKELFEQETQLDKKLSDVSKASTAVGGAIGSGAVAPWELEGQIDKPDYQEAEDNANWTGEQRSQQTADNKAAGDKLVDDYNTDKQRSAWDPYWNKNHAKDNWRGNLNGKSYANTLNLSRAADALNNRRFWEPGQGGRRTNSEFGTNEVQLGRSERWQPIETQEMRQMRANERIDERARQADVDLAADVRRNTFDMQQQNQSMQFALAQALGMSAIQLQDYMKRGRFDMEYRAQFQQMLQQKFQQFTTSLAQSTKVESLRRALQEYGNNPEVANLIAQGLLGGVSMPTVKNMLISQMYGQLVQAGGNPEEIYRLMHEIQLRLSQGERYGFYSAFKG